VLLARVPGTYSEDVRGTRRGLSIYVLSGPERYLRVMSSIPAVLEFKPVDIDFRQSRNLACAVRRD
jgi:hypothetical protein